MDGSKNLDLTIYISMYIVLTLGTYGFMRGNVKSRYLLDYIQRDASLFSCNLTEKYLH